jgi:PKD repeat protein
MKNILILSIALIFLTCKKSETSTVTVTDNEAVPSASFTTDKAEYDGGQVIKLTNTSTNAESIRWTLPDGTTSKDASVSYAIDPSLGDVKLNIKLEAISKSGTKSDYVVKSVKVNPGKGLLTLYSSFRQVDSVNIVINGDTIGLANFDYTKGKPAACSQLGYTTFTLNRGTHVLNYSRFSFSGSFYGTKTFSLNTGACVILNCN